MRLTTLTLQFTLHTHNMVLRPSKNLLEALEVEWLQNICAQKVAWNEDFGVSNWIPGNLSGNDVHFITYYTYSTGLWRRWEHLAMHKDTWRGNEVFWICFGHLQLLSTSYLDATKHSLQVTVTIYWNSTKIAMISYILQYA